MCAKFRLWAQNSGPRAKYRLWVQNYDYERKIQTMSSKRFSEHELHALWDTLQIISIHKKKVLVIRLRQWHASYVKLYSVYIISNFVNFRKILIHLRERLNLLSIDNFDY